MRTANSISSSGSSIHTPLLEICSWRNNETVLVTDSVESDGRFVLCTLAAAASISSNQNRVLWICCTALTDTLTLAALRKIGCDKDFINSAHLPESSLPSSPRGAVSPRLTIKSIPELLDVVLSSNREEMQQDFDAERFIKGVYKSVSDWIRLSTQDTTAANHTSNAWVILDDVSALSSLIGEQCTYELILSLQSLKSYDTQNGYGLALRCSNSEYIDSFTTRPSSWFGAGENDTLGATARPREESLVELADVVVDVLPLSSGYTREAHGRLMLTGRTHPTSLMCNYCLTENQASVIRINTR